MLDCINLSQHLVFVHLSEMNGNSNIDWCGLFFGVPSCVRMARTSKNANLSSWSSSIVKFMFESPYLNDQKDLFTSLVCMITNVSSTNRYII